MPLKRFLRRLRHLSLIVVLLVPAWQALADDNMMGEFNDMDDTALVDDPWGCVINGVIIALPGVQPAVDDNGKVTNTVFSPSIAVGDLNGDGLPDIVMADARGYFWYFANHGSSTQPEFTTAEVMPIWLGTPVGATRDDNSLVTHNYPLSDNIVSRIQLVDFNGSKRLSIVAGNFEGKLFYIANIGTSTRPAFSMPNDLANITVSTYSDNHLWCNFLAPFLYDFTGNGTLDLVMGEGTYASNSIYLLRNKGNNASPLFTENFTTKIIPGYGREHLTPQVVDWNNDGKPDIICGERSGYVDLFLNKSPDNVPGHIQFDDPPPPARPHHIKFGSQEQVGLLTTVAVCDLNGNKLPNLIVSNSDDTVSYARNKGIPGAPAFDMPAPIHAVNPLKKVYQAPENWRITKAFSMPYVAMVCTNVRDDPSYKPPEDAPTLKSALKIYTVPHTHTYFPNEVYPAEDTHAISCDATLRLQTGVRYAVSFWMKTDGTVQNPRYLFSGHNRGEPYFVAERPAATGSDWTQVKDTILYEKGGAYVSNTVDTRFHFLFNGNGGTVWLAGFDMRKAQ